MQRCPKETAHAVLLFHCRNGCNQVIDSDTAKEMSHLFIEAIIAPGFSDEAFEILSQKPSIRLIELPSFSEQESAFQVKYVHGGMLLQSPDKIVIDEGLSEVVTNRRPESHEIRDLTFAFTICKHVKSNAIVLVKNGQTIGIGAGQMSRVEAVDIAIKKSEGLSQGAVCASDAFFPFKDSVERLVKAGITAIIQPGGSVRDQESIDASNDNDIAMITTGIRHFKH